MTMTEEAPPAVDDAGSAAADVESGDKKGKKGKGKKDKSAKGKSNLVPALVLAAGIAAGGYFMGGGTSAATTETVEVAAAPEPGEVAELDALTVNLAGGRFLRVGVSFLTTKELEVIHGDPKKGTPSRFKPEYENRLRDQVIAMFAGRELSEVVGSSQLEEAKAELLERANEVLGDKVLEVYFTEFVTQ